MSGTATLPFTQAPADPQLKDVLDQLKKNILLSLNCHHIGTVQSFDATNQKATATINYTQTIYTLNSKTGTYTQSTPSYPVLLDCPVIFLGGGPASLTFPVQKGDTCLVLFNDRDLDTWYTGGSSTSPPATARLHSLADGIILVGLRSMNNLLSAIDLTRAVLQWGSTVVAVSASKVKISNQSIGTLGTLLNTFATQAQSLATQTAALTVTSFGSPPTNAAAIAMIASQLATTATQISGLLE